MGHKIIKQAYATEAEAKADAKATETTYSETYVRRGPYKAKSVNGDDIWVVEFEQYYG